MDSLLERGAIAPEADSELEKVYARFRAPSISAPTSDDSNETRRETAHGDAAPASADGGTERQALLTRDAVPAILKLYGLPESSGADIYRAIEQARQRTKITV